MASSKVRSGSSEPVASLEVVVLIVTVLFAALVASFLWPARSSWSVRGRYPGETSFERLADYSNSVFASVFSSHNTIPLMKFGPPLKKLHLIGHFRNPSL